MNALKHGRDAIATVTVDAEAVTVLVENRLSTSGAPAPGTGPGYWAGAPSAVLDDDGTYVVAYRVRNGPDGLDRTVVARSSDGENFTTVATLDGRRFGANWMERPALVKAGPGRWRRRGPSPPARRGSCGRRRAPPPPSAPPRRGGPRA